MMLLIDTGLFYFGLGLRIACERHTGFGIYYGIKILRDDRSIWIVYQGVVRFS